MSIRLTMVVMVGSWSEQGGSSRQPVGADFGTGVDDSVVFIDGHQPATSDGYRIKQPVRWTWVASSP